MDVMIDVAAFGDVIREVASSSMSCEMLCAQPVARLT